MHTIKYLTWNDLSRMAAVIMAYLSVNLAASWWLLLSGRIDVLSKSSLFTAFGAVVVPIATGFIAPKRDFTRPRAEDRESGWIAKEKLLLVGIYLLSPLITMSLLSPRAVIFTQLAFEQIFEAVTFFRPERGQLYMFMFKRKIPFSVWSTFIYLLIGLATSILLSADGLLLLKCLYLFFLSLNISMTCLSESAITIADHLYEIIDALYFWWTKLKTCIHSAVSGYT